MGVGTGVGAAACAVHRLWTARRAPHTDTGRPHRRRRTHRHRPPAAAVVLPRKDARHPRLRQFLSQVL